MEAELGFWAFSKIVVIPRLIEGMGVTLKLTFLSGTLGLILGMVLALLRISQYKILNWISLFYITLFRGTPLLLQILFIYFALPTIFEAYQINMVLDSFSAGVLALSLNSAAYLAEIYRAGILSIPKGQTEAARALGLSRHQTMYKIIIPQTYRRIIPPIVNELSALTKETSLVSVISLGELLYMTQRLGSKYLRVWEVYIWAAVGYLIIVMVLSFIASRIEKRLELKGGV
ncbi:amino acid ABC transporter permease [Bacteriovorax sp. PP10]|uniref:Amino acid ABC transporter permease n=1 Tax=Bacteriovorax antarcticus TaxID=3088717 RepID=A0ABU5VTG7_9BACT|nr:amino acid ABC transporter permease [Bacteriovorax sp. PP10]MEA9356347.1 amino acid ABC transporter permease [Bacteriovorax sp. PP10]